MLPILFSTVFILIQSFAGERTQGSVSIEIKNGKLSASVKEGFHFNAKAPNGFLLSSQPLIKPSQLSYRAAEFTNLPKEWKMGEATFYICDDAITFCEVNKLTVHNPDLVDSSQGDGVEVKQVRSLFPDIEKAQKKGMVNTYGFIEDDYARALDQAKKEKKLLLIGFSARWCPSCVRLEKEIFPSREFGAQTRAFVRLKIDVDRFENSVISEKFNVKGIPTLLVINSAQEEISRISDYQPNSELAKFFSSIKSDSATLSALVKKAKKKNPEILLRLGRRLSAAGRYRESLSYLTQIQPPPRELLAVRVQAAEPNSGASKTSKAKYAAILKEAIELEPESLRSLGWRTELVRVIKDKEEKLEIKKDGISIAEDFLKDKEAILENATPDEIGEFLGYEQFLVGIMRAELIAAALAPASDVTAAWRRAAQVARELSIPVAQTGINLRRLSVLLQAKLFAEADKLTQAMLLNDPENPEIQRRRLHVLLELKKYSAAADIGKSVISKSFGRNEFWVAGSLAKALVEAKRYDEARDLVNSYLNRHELEWPKMQDSRKQLESLLAKIP